MPSETNFFQQFKPKTVAGWVVSGLFFVGSLIVQYTSAHTHAADVQAQLEQRVTALEKDAATRRELTDFKSDATSRLDRIEEKIDRQIRYFGLRK